MEDHIVSRDHAHTATAATPKSAAPFEWTHDRQAQLEQLAAEELSGAEIAERMGVSRSAVLGRCHRTGVKLRLTARKRARMAEPLSRARKPRQRPPADSPLRRPRPKGAPVYSEEQKVAAIAARLAGASYRTAARLIGASPQTLSYWLKDPALLARARALYERAREQAHQEATARRALLQLQAESERLRVARNNRPLLDRMLPRHRIICERAVAGDPLSEIGRDFGITRERVRQVVARWRADGLIVPEARALGEATKRAYPGWVRGPWR